MNQETGTGNVTKKSPALKIIGCGCLGIFVLGIIGVVGMVTFFGKVLKNNPPYKDSIVAVQSSSAAVDALGEPIKPGFMPSGNISVTNDSGTVEFSIPVKGPKGSGTIVVKGTRSGGVWSYETWHLKVNGQEDVIPLSKQ
jgi:hypothetical protein